MKTHTAALSCATPIAELKGTTRPRIFDVATMVLKIQGGSSGALSTRRVECHSLRRHARHTRKRTTMPAHAAASVSQCVLVIVALPARHRFMVSLAVPQMAPTPMPVKTMKAGP